MDFEDRTPDNTPTPGGGSWRWDARERAWVDSSTPETEPQAQPTDTEQE